MSIKDAEDHIDHVLENLRIYRFPLHLALFMILSVFEALNAGLRQSMPSWASAKSGAAASASISIIRALILTASLQKLKRLQDDTGAADPCAF